MTLASVARHIQQTLQEFAMLRSHQFTRIQRFPAIQHDIAILTNHPHFSATLTNHRRLPQLSPVGVKSSVAPEHVH